MPFVVVRLTLKLLGTQHTNYLVQLDLFSVADFSGEREICRLASKVSNLCPWHPISPSCTRVRLRFTIVCFRSLVGTVDWVFRTYNYYTRNKPASTASERAKYPPHEQSGSQTNGPSLQPWRSLLLPCHLHLYSSRKAKSWYHPEANCTIALARATGSKTRAGLTISRCNNNSLGCNTSYS